MVTLSGNAGLWIDKVNAEKGIRKIQKVDGIRNHIDVPTVFTMGFDSINCRMR